MTVSGRSLPFLSETNSLSLFRLTHRSYQNPVVRNEVMHAYSRSISTIWLVNTPLSAFGLFLVLFIRGYTLERTIIRGGEKKLGDVEKDAVQVTIEEDSPVTESGYLEKEKRQDSCDDTTEPT